MFSCIKMSNVALNVDFPHSNVYLQNMEIDRDFLLRNRKNCFQILEHFVGFFPAL